jgi:hypothetical protein
MNAKTSGVNSNREADGVSSQPACSQGASKSEGIARGIPSYRAPKLVRFGTLLELTQSGSGVVGESGVARSRRPRPQS